MITAYMLAGMCCIFNQGKYMSYYCLYCIKLPCHYHYTTTGNAIMRERREREREGDKETCLFATPRVGLQHTRCEIQNTGSFKQAYKLHYVQNNKHQLCHHNTQFTWNSMTQQPYKNTEITNINNKKKQDKVTANDLVPMGLRNYHICWFDTLLKGIG